MEKLKHSDFEQAAQRLGCDIAVIRAVVAVESSGAGFSSDGRAVLRFENHKFWEFWGENKQTTFAQHFKFNALKRWQGHRVNLTGEWINPHASQSNEWRTFEFARALDEEAAMLSISLGLFQIMGFNFQACGNATVQEWFWDHCESEARQLERFCTFIQSRKLDRHLQRLDFYQFARAYNGPGKATEYAKKLREAHESF